MTISEDRHIPQLGYFFVASHTERHYRVLRFFVMGLASRSMSLFSQGQPRRTSPCALVEKLSHEVGGVSGGAIRQLCEDFVPEAFVERACLEAQRLKKDALTSERPRLVFGSPQEPLAVALAAERLRNPEKREVEPASPHVPERPAENRIAIVSE